MARIMTFVYKNVKHYILAAVLVLILVVSVATVMALGNKSPSEAKESDAKESEEVFLQDPQPDDSWKLERSEEFFVEYRLERERIRSREIDVLQQMISNPNTSSDSKKEAERKLLEIQRLMEQELAVENSLVALGYQHAIMFYQNGNANIVVNAEALTREERARIAELVSKILGLERYQISITEKGN